MNPETKVMVQWDSGTMVDYVDFCEGEPNTPPGVGHTLLALQGGRGCYDVTHEAEARNGYICEKSVKFWA